MRASVIIRSKDEAPRLRLTLASLAGQTERPEVVVVNDGSSDETRDVITEAAQEVDLVAVHNPTATGRSAAANAGARAASGDIVLFLDGDTLAGPDLVEQHMKLHRQKPNLVVRGETFHLRGTRLFLDPEAGTPRPGEEARVERMSAAERARSIVTRQQIREDFAGVDARAQGGVYPGFGPRKLYEMEMQALYDQAGRSVLWTAASGSNQSLSRQAFIASGGFHPDITINEHRELALRLCQSGLEMAGTPARTYHMIHRSGWRDPLEDKDWEDIFYAAHPTPEVALMPLVWLSLSEACPLPEKARLPSLAALEEAAARHRDLVGRDREAVRQAHIAWAERQLESQ